MTDNQDFEHASARGPPYDRAPMATLLLMMLAAAPALHEHAFRLERAAEAWPWCARRARAATGARLAQAAVLACRWTVRFASTSC